MPDLLNGAPRDEERPEIDSLLARFDESWSEQAFGRFVRKLPLSDDDARRSALSELIKIDLERRWSSGHRIRLEAYLKAFPELGDPSSVSADLIMAEYSARCISGTSPNLAAFSKRFPDRQEELRLLIQELDASLVAGPATEESHSSDSEPGATLRSESGSMLTQQLPEQFGKFRILRRLGEGGMGSVYLAEDTKLRRNVALKVPHRNQISSPQACERFYREARAAAGLDHPSICSVFDVNEFDGVHYIEMAYVDGIDLSQRIRDGEPMEQREVARIIATLATALEYAHQKGVIHRDLKPLNIRIKENGEPVIMDFGLAKIFGDDFASFSKDGQLIGTPMYMSPEQAIGTTNSVNASYDIYSLGVVMYEMLAGVPPFQGSGIYAIVKQVVDTEPAPIREQRAEIDRSLEAICLKAMSKQPQHRFATMAEMDAATQAFLQAPPLSAIPPEFPRAETNQLPHGSFEGNWHHEQNAGQLLQIMTVNKNHAKRAFRMAISKEGIPLKGRKMSWVTAVAVAAVSILLAIVLWPRYGNLSIQINDNRFLLKLDDRVYRRGDVEVRLSEGIHIWEVIFDQDFIPTEGTTIAVAHVGERRVYPVFVGQNAISDEITIRRGDNQSLNVSLLFPPERPSSIDLVQLIDPDYDSRGGNWRRNDGKLVSSGRSGIIEIPYDPPTEYRLTAVVERKGEESDLSFGLVVGGQPCLVWIDWYRRRKGGISKIRFKNEAEDNPTKYQSLLIERFKETTIVCKVRSNRIEIYCDDKPIIDWTGDPKSLAQDMEGPNRNRLFLHCKREWEFSKLELTPLSDSEMDAIPTVSNTVDRYFQGLVTRFDPDTLDVEIQYDFETDEVPWSDLKFTLNYAGDRRGRFEVKDRELIVDARRASVHRALFRDVRVRAEVSLDAAFNDATASVLLRSNGAGDFYDLKWERDNTSDTDSVKIEKLVNWPNGSLETLDQDRLLVRSNPRQVQFEAKSDLLSADVGDQSLSQQDSRYTVGRVGIWGRHARFDNLVISGTLDREWFRDTFGTESGN